jgi:hypothetical protein
MPPILASPPDMSGAPLHMATVFVVLLGAVLAAILAASSAENSASDEPQSQFLQYTARPDGTRAMQEAMVFHETGYHVATLDYMWLVYHNCLPTRERAPQMVAAYFYLAFVYIHLYPTHQQAPRVLWTPAMANKFQGRGITRNLIQDWITPIIFALATALRDKPQVCWEDRLRRDNHTPFLPTVVTGAIDTGPLYVCQPKRRRNARLLFQPKYHACVYKMQVIVSFLGHIIGYTGLHNGVECDSKIWNRTRHLFPMADGELLLADGIYKGQPGLMVKYDVDHTNTDGDRMTNDIIDLYRSRVEDLMHEVTSLVLTFAVISWLA